MVATQKNEDRKNYNSFRRKLNKKKKRRKKAYFRNLVKEANAKKDFRKTWQVINKVLKSGSKKLTIPNKLSDEGITTQSLKAMANIMNKHFTTVGEKLAAKRYL